MADKINGHGGKAHDISSSRNRPARAERADAHARPSGTRAPVDSREDGSVRLTDTATQLKQIEARLESVPDVDARRVAEIRERVESGSYRIDARRVAERLAQFERSLT